MIAEIGAERLSPALIWRNAPIFDPRQMTSIYAMIEPRLEPP
jgi:hypothetical protein